MSHFLSVYNKVPVLHKGLLVLHVSFCDGLSCVYLRTGVCACMYAHGSLCRHLHHVSTGYLSMCMCFSCKVECFFGSKPQSVSHRAAERVGVPCHAHLVGLQTATINLVIINNCFLKTMDTNRSECINV